MHSIRWVLSFFYRQLRQVIAQLCYAENRRILYLNYRWESELVQRAWRKKTYGKKQWWSRFLEDVVGQKRGVFCIVLFGVFGTRHTLKLPTRSKKVWLTEEDTEFRFKEYDDYCLGQADLSLGFKNLNHPDYLRFPFWIYQFINPGFENVDSQLGLSGLTTLYEPKKFCEQIEKANRFSQRRFFAGIVSRHDSHGNGAGLRASLMDVLQSQGKVISAGKWRNNSPVLKDEYDDDLRRFLGDCRYNICIENTNSAGYVTEKVFQAFLAGSIPIYWGGGSYFEPEVLTGNGVIRMIGKDANEVAREVACLEGDSAYREDWLNRPILTPWAVEWIEERLFKLKQHLEILLKK